MKIALIGFGGMGKAVYRIAFERGHEIPVLICPTSPEATDKALTAELAKQVDLVIDCSLGEFVMDHAQMCSEAETNLVTVATGWYEQLDEMKSLIESSEIGMIWSSNFSIGVNLFFKMVANAAQLINQFDEYDVWGHEIHHMQKADSPSGTAKTLENILLENIDRKTEVVEDKLNRKREDHEIHFSSLRGGAVNFKHDIGFDSAADTITLTHAARNRDGYALGTVKAAEWLLGKKGYFEMEDFLTSQS